MRFGGPVFEELKNPESWIQALKENGYTAAYCPVEADAADSLIADYTVYF